MMNLTNDPRDQAMEDLGLIRRVLDQTAASFRTLAPSFRGLGLLWLILGLPYFVIQFWSVLTYLFPGLDPHGTSQYLSQGYDGARLLLAVGLLVQCLLWQRRKREFRGFDRKLLTLWQVLLLAFLVLSVLIEVGQNVWQQQPMAMGETLGGSYQNDIVVGAVMCLQALQPALFPGLPLVFTGVFLEDRLARVLGLVMAVFSLCALLQGFFPVDGGALYWIYTFLWMLAPLFAPVTILILARQLGKQPRPQTETEKEE